MKLIWLTDLHLEFLTEKPIREFLRRISEEKPDAILITGDISNATHIEYHLVLLADSLPQTIYFLLGNHDFYLGSFGEVDAQVQKVRGAHPNLIELGHGEIISLSNDTALIGHRGWADDPKWQRLGITPLLYKAGEEHGGHAKLEGALKAWADQTALRPTEIASRLQQILANPNLRSKSDEDFVLRHYNKELTVGAFTEHALQFEWVIWLHSKGVIKPMLTEAGTRPTDWHLAYWLGTMMARDKTGTGFAILSDCGGRLNFHAARGVFMEIMRGLAASAPDLTQKEWLRILLQQPPASYFHLHSRMVAPLVKHGEWNLALDYFEFLVRPYIASSDVGGRYSRFGEVGPRPVLTGEHFDLGETWQMISGAATGLVDRQRDILEVLEKACLRLGEQCRLLGLDSHHHPNLVSYFALSRAEYEDDSIGAFVRLFAQHASVMATAGLLDEKKMSRWMGSRNQVLIRCALLCMRQGQFAASTVLDLLVKNNGFYPLALFAVEELTPLLHSIYPQLSDQEKALLWSEVEKGPSDEWTKGSPDE